MWRHGILIGSLLAADAPPSSVTLQPGHTTTVVVAADVGAPLERAVPGKFYAQAAAADGEQRWADAAALYREAVNEWTSAGRLQPSRALELAAMKAERERQRSQLLASRVRMTTGSASRFGRDPFSRRADALDEARLLRAKLLAVRAVLERAPPALFAHTRDRLREALRAGGGGAATRMGGDGEIHLLLCSTYAAGGEIEPARLERAHVTEAERADPVNAVPLAECAAALGETRAALGELEVLALHPGPGRIDRFALRDIYLYNDWDRLRGDPRFETLFPR
ncbi:MAG TPA: hypothetical protein VIF57_23995 [Polyangia bacterium]